MLEPSTNAVNVPGGSGRVAAEDGHTWNVGTSCGWRPPAAALVAAPRTSRAATGRIDVLVNEPIGTIAPDIYGHFVEHLGGVVYDGVWVGEGSKVPNTQGIRQAVIDGMKKLPKGAIRWPGGCFADSYDWRDGTGPREQRPRRTNFWAGGTRGDAMGPSKYDPNHFGSVDFARLCRLVGSEPYFAANLRSLPARDFYQWVEYCNSPAGTTALADLRARDGAKDPLKVRYWGVGNESWGCGGDFTAEEYAVEFRRFTSWVPGFDTPLSFVASGPSSGDLELDARLLQQADREGAGNGRPRRRLRPAPLHREPELRRSGQERVERAQGPGDSASRPPSGTRSSRKPIGWSR